MSQQNCTRPTISKRLEKNVRLLNAIIKDKINIGCCEIEDITEFVKKYINFLNYTTYFPYPSEVTVSQKLVDCVRKRSNQPLYDLEASIVFDSDEIKAIIPEDYLMVKKYFDVNLVKYKKLAKSTKGSECYLSEINLPIKSFSNVKHFHYTPKATPKLPKIVNVDVCATILRYLNGGGRIMTSNFNKPCAYKRYIEDCIFTEISLFADEVDGDFKHTKRTVHSKDIMSLYDIFHYNHEDYVGIDEDVYQHFPNTVTEWKKVLIALNKLIGQNLHWSNDLILRNFGYLFPTFSDKDSLSIELKKQGLTNVLIKRFTMDDVSTEIQEYCTHCLMFGKCYCVRALSHNWPVPIFCNEDEPIFKERKRPCSRFCFKNEENYCNKLLSDFNELEKARFATFYQIFGPKFCRIKKELTTRYPTMRVKCSHICHFIRKFGSKSIIVQERIMLPPNLMKKVPYAIFSMNLKNDYFVKGKYLNNGSIYFCHHSGACSVQNNCICAIRKTICTEKCLCPPSCSVKFCGCDCTKGNCKPSNCRCMILGWECMPSVCSSCKCIPFATKDVKSTCQNSHIQRGMIKASYKAKSLIVGNGCFSKNDVKRGELFDFYTGEIISSYIADERASNIYNKEQLTYLFILDQAYSIDAKYFGNVTRYINNSTSYGNLTSRITVVNSVNVIGLYALKDIAKNQELTFDYHFSDDVAMHFIDEPPKIIEWEINN
uniref:[Histone H3]-lysine(27) N-trimethyltransferase n=1 Tax=Rhabditophanes sp. KR3021 TaxID=114890 RepID=A0AC35U490_9BILA